MTYATITPISGPLAGTLLTKWNLIIALLVFDFQLVLYEILVLSPIIPFLLLAAWVGNDHLFWPALFLIVSLAISGVLQWYKHDWILRDRWSSRYLLFRAQRIFTLRLGSVVDPHDPEAFLIEIIPRNNWKKWFDEAEDIGFLKIDTSCREIRIEGDRMRYCIPATSIRNCFVARIVSSNNGPAAVIIVCEIDEEREIELPVAVLRMVSGKFIGNDWSEQASTLAKSIRRIWIDANVGKRNRR